MPEAARRISDKSAGGEGCRKEYTMVSMESKEQLREEFRRRVERNFERLCGDLYAGEKVFREATYDWPGDWEGRYLLASVLLRRLTGRETASFPYLMEHLGEHTNEYGYFGEVTDGNTVSEQQLSGNGWFLRGLCELYADSPEASLRRRIESIVSNLFMKCTALYARYPVSGARAQGGVAGSAVGENGGWLLSSDVGCAFIALDGVTAAYALFPSEELKTFIDGCIEKFLSVDKLAVHMQTHSTLTCCRAILRMYRATKEARYLARAREVFDLYVSHGMTLTYENFNWFGREDTWTEPCAVTDSLIAALDLYDATAQPQYLTLARRIWLNGFRLCQRINGGAGPNSCVTVRNGVWEMRMYEAYFCCTMRTAEGLYRAGEALDLLLSEADADACRAPEQDGFGRWMCGDRLLCSINGGTLAALPDIMEVGEEELKTLRLQIVFPKGEGL